jgi:hypothetical protein
MRDDAFPQSVHRWASSCAAVFLDYDTRLCRNGDDLIFNKSWAYGGSSYSGCDYGPVSVVKHTSAGGKLFSAGMNNYVWYYFDGGGTRNGTYAVVGVQVP